MNQKISSLSTPISKKEIISNAVELAALIGKYMSPQKYRELLRGDTILLSEIQKAISSSEKEIFLEISGEKKAFKKDELKNLLSITQADIKKKKLCFKSFLHTGNIEELAFLLPKQEKKIVSWKDFLGKYCPQNEKERIQELYSIPEVRDVYTRELTDRKENFDLLHEGNERLGEILSRDALIYQGKDKILSIKSTARSSHRKISTMEQSIMQRITLGIEQEGQQKEQLLQERPLATAYRNHTLATYKKQLDTLGFVFTPSRQKIVDHIEELVLTGNHVILVGPTGTGKTALALQAIQGITKNIGKEAYVSEISGGLLTEQINVQEASKEVDTFIHVLSGHAGITPSEFIAKTKLRADGKGGTETHTELGKILKAFVEGSIPLIDEVDLIPNEILMRIKHLFTLRTTELYSPQEDGNQKYSLLSNVVIATANIKSKKHPGREDIDPALLRLFRGVNVSYLPQEELYDLALVSLMEAEGYIHGISGGSLSGETSFLCTLITAIKEIEENYLGNGGGETTSAGAQMFLKKTLLETGRFIKLFAGYHGNGLYFHDFIRKNLLDMLCDYSLPKQDRLIIMRILGTKSLINQSDISQILSNSFDYTEKELHETIVSQNSDFSSTGIDFLDTYEVANLDPYKQRNLLDLGASENVRLIGFFQGLSQYLSLIEDDEDKEKLQELLDTVLEQYDIHGKVTLSEIQQKQLVSLVSELLFKDPEIQSYIDPISSLREKRS